MIKRVALTRCKDGSIVSTVRLPFTHIGGDYETSVFTGLESDENDVVVRYETLDLAREGHQRRVRAGGGAAILQPSWD